MLKKNESRLVRSDDFIAELLESDAEKLPKSEGEAAGLLRKVAKRYRDSSRPKVIRVYEETQEDFNQAAFRSVQETIKRGGSDH